MESNVINPLAKLYVGLKKKKNKETKNVNGLNL